MDHLLVHAAASRIRLVWAHVKILIPELTPDADHFDPFGFVGLDQKIVFHNYSDLKGSIIKAFHDQVPSKKGG
jgi:hypothetical protein